MNRLSGNQTWQGKIPYKWRHMEVYSWENHRTKWWIFQNTRFDYQGVILFSSGTWKIHGSVRALGLPGSRRSTSSHPGDWCVFQQSSLNSPRSCVTAHLCSDSPYAGQGLGIGLGPRSPLLQKTSASNESPCCLLLFVSPSHHRSPGLRAAMLKRQCGAVKSNLGNLAECP